MGLNGPGLWGLGRSPHESVGFSVGALKGRTFLSFAHAGTNKAGGGGAGAACICISTYVINVYMYGLMFSSSAGNSWPGRCDTTSHEAKAFGVYGLEFGLGMHSFQ